VGATIAWLWQSDRLPGPATVKVGDGVHLPLGARMLRSHSWWATVILLVVDATVLASMAFAHIHVAMRAAVCPPPGTALPGADVMAASVAAFAASAAVMWFAGRRVGQRPAGRWYASGMAAAGALAFAGFWLLLQAHLAAGLAPRAQAWSATLAAMLFYQGFHLAIQGLLGVYLAGRALRGLLGPRRCASHDNGLLLWVGACVQGVAIALLPYAVVWAMS
jgi:cytochrome c oxidase subunit I+III